MLLLAEWSDRAEIMTRKRKPKIAKNRKTEPRGESWKSLFVAVFCIVVAIGGVWWAFTENDPANAAPGEVIVYKSPSCGCCAKWVDHMRDAGFEVKVNNTSDVYPIKQEYGLPRGMGSCHTAIVDGYVIEGHVPANDVQRLLAEKPIARGLAVPGMPIGSPGMEQGSYKERYEVILFGPEGSKVFARH